jgi:hypothetical protein
MGSNKIRLFFAGIFLASIILAGAPAYSQPVPNVYDGGNMWTITFFNDAHPQHQQWATQILCFNPHAPFGTGIVGTWVALTFPGWKGRYYQEGDRLTMTGDYAQDVGHDGIEAEHTTYDRLPPYRGLATGHWKEWRENGGFGFIIGWGNTQLMRVGKCHPKGIPDITDSGVGTSPDDRIETEIVALQLSSALPLRMLANGEEALEPGEQGQESVKAYLRDARKTIDSFFDVFFEVKIEQVPPPAPREK